MSGLRSALGLWVAWLVVVSVVHEHLSADTRPTTVVASAPTAGASTDAVPMDLAALATVAPKPNVSYDLGFLPVTCHLTCPVTDYIEKTTGTPSIFKPQRFGAFPEMKEAFLAGRTPAAFVLAPLAIGLREQGAPVKIVYLGHRDGTAMMVAKDSAIQTVADLKGKTVAIPNRFSNQYLLLYLALKQTGLTPADVNIVEMPPPEMPVALQSHTVDAVTAGEPFMARTEMEGFGRVLYQAKDIWPDFISCVLVVREELIRDDPGSVRELVDGIARSGKWLEAGMDNRMAASQFVGTKYYNQKPELLAYVLSKPPDRVRYDDLALRRADFEKIEALGKEAGILTGKATFDDYADPRFSQLVAHPVAWNWKAD
jgi:NitT/TauT family transport system substrate-binding protein